MLIILMLVFLNIYQLYFYDDYLGNYMRILSLIELAKFVKIRYYTKKLDILVLYNDIYKNILLYNTSIAISIVYLTYVYFYTKMTYLEPYNDIIQLLTYLILNVNIYYTSLYSIYLICEHINMLKIIANNVQFDDILVYY
jgi:hypothetical protein